MPTMKFSLALMLAGALSGAVCQVASAADAIAPTATSKASPASPFVKTASGLQYQDIKLGTGLVANAGTTVTVHYTGWLQNPDGSTGKKFDSSRDGNGPFKFPLGAGRVIKGWDEGVQGMKVGGVRKLIIPAALGYGARGAGGVIPPDATLIFEVELLGV